MMEEQVNTNFISSEDALIKDVVSFYQENELKFTEIEETMEEEANTHVHTPKYTDCGKNRNDQNYAGPEDITDVYANTNIYTPEDSSRRNTLRKKTETSAEPKDFQNVFISNIVLNLLEDMSVDNFNVWSNDNICDFEDVVIETNEQQYAVQFVHFFTCDDDFNIQKIFQSFQNTKTFLSDSKLLLVTNRTFDSEIGKNLTIQLSDEEGEIEVTGFEVDTIPFLGNNQSCFQFKITPESSINTAPNVLEKYETFFENFFVYTNTDDVTTLQETVRVRMKKISVRDEVADNYLTFFLGWNREKLSRSMMTQLLALYLVSPYIHPFLFNQNENKNYKILQAAMSKFVVTVLDEKSVGQLQQISDKSINYFKTERANAINREYQLSENDTDNLTNEDCSKLLWLMDGFPLIVDENPEVRTAIKISNKSFILLTKNSMDFENTEVFQKLSDLKKHPQIYHDVLFNFTIWVSGTKVSLAKLVKNYDLLPSSITTNDLLLISNGYKIEQKSEDLPVFYKSGLLSRNFIDLCFLNEIKNDTLVLVSNVCTENENLIKKYEYVDVEKYLKINHQSQNDRKTNLVVSKGHCSTQKFKSIRAKTKKINLHHLKFTDQKLEWVESVGNISTLKRHRSENGSIKEKELDELNSENRIHLVDDSALGESLFLKSLRNRFLPSAVTTLITPDDIDNICRFFKNNRNIHNLTKYILELKHSNWTDFDISIVSYLIKARNLKVVYLWDALDEIVDENRKTIIKIIREFSKQRVATQWIICRQQQKQTLEAEFAIFAKTVSKLDRHQQVQYVKERLESVCVQDLDLIATKIVDAVALYRHRDELSIPLQIHMLTELFRRNSKTIKDFTEGLFSLVDLYEHFVEDKINSLCTQNEEFDDIAAVALEKVTIIKQLELFALKTTLPHHRSNLDIDEEPPINFDHISYAEYFAAHYFARVRDPQIKDFIFQEECTNIRYFFDLIMAKNCPAHTAVLCNNLSQLKEHQDKFVVKDAAGRNPLHLTCSWGKRYPVLTFRKVEDDAGTNRFHSDNSYVHCSDNPSDYLKMIEELARKCDFNENDEIFGMNVLEYARATENLFFLALAAEISNIKNFDSPNIQCINFFKSYLDRLTVGSLGNSLLHFACEEENESLVETIVNAGVTINVSNDNGDTPLIVTCKRGNEKIVKMLINADGDINSSNKKGDTPLIWACINGNRKIVELLINKGANINACNIFEQSPFNIACVNGDEEIAELLINAGVNITGSDNQNKNTPLLFACVMGNEKIVQLLIKAGIKVNDSCKNDDTPLIIACNNGNEQLAKLLISAGIKMDVSDKNGDTPLIISCRKKNVKIAELLINAGVNTNVSEKNGDTPLIIACKDNNKKMVEVLIKNKVSVNCSNNNGERALDIACSKGNKPIVELLINADAAVSMKNLTIACTGNYDIFKLLVNTTSRPSINTFSSAGHTLLTLSCLYGIERNVELLINAEADINLSAERGKTPLIIACEKGYQKVVKLLIDAGANVDAADFIGDTPLIKACKIGHEKVVELLLKSKANVNAHNRNGETPMIWAFKKETDGIKNMLSDAGASMDIAYHMWNFSNKVYN